MSRDAALARAMDALRKAADGSSADPQVSRRLILARAQVSRPKRRVAVVLLPIAATLLVSTAWGAASGRLPHWVQALRQSRVLRSDGSWPGPSIATQTSRTTPAPVAAPSASESAEAANVEIPRETTEVAPVRQLPTAKPSMRTASPRAKRPEPQAPGISNAERATYGEAHAAHFVQRDPAAALRAWDAYLADYPRGSFALEAHYNRAISLARLGRRQEARSALEPFVHGSFGGYRQAEARTLLDALTDP